MRRITQKAFPYVEGQVKELLEHLLGSGRIVDIELVKETIANKVVYVLGAYLGGRLVGIAVGNQKPHLTGKEFYIDDVVIHPEFQNRGFGRAILDKLEDVALDLGCRGVMLTSSREGAQRFYERLGYQTKTKAFKRML